MVMNQFDLTNSGSTPASAVSTVAPGTQIYTFASSLATFQGENAVKRRTLTVSSTANQQITIVVYEQSGAIGGSALPIEPLLTVTLPAGNVTPQIAELSAGGLRVISGTPTLTGNAGDMNDEFTTETVYALAAVLPTTGTLAWDDSEIGD